MTKAHFAAHPIRAIGSRPGDLKKNVKFLLFTNKKKEFDFIVEIIVERELKFEIKNIPGEKSRLPGKGINGGIEAKTH